MKNIVLSYFPSVFTLESFFVTINLKLNSKCEEDTLKETLKRLSSVIIAFDFELNGPYRSYVDRRFSYEQLLYLCCLKINESKMPAFDNHMLKSNLTALQSITQNLNNQADIERKLVTSENLSLLYFIDKNGDGAYWRQLHGLIGSSIMKYLLLYGFIFKLQKGSTSTYVQLCGPRFNFVFRNLVARKLEADEKAIISKCVQKKKPPATNLPDKKQVDVVNKNVTKINLNEVFAAKEKQFESELAAGKAVESQLNQLGHKPLNKRAMLYDRNLSSKTPKKFVYSDRDLPANEKTASIVIDKFIFKNINLELYTDKTAVDELKLKLNEAMVKFLQLHRTCPYRVFLHCYCKNPKAKEINTKKTKTQENERIKSGGKRKRDSDSPIRENKTEEATSESSRNVEPKLVYCFVRRCLMHVLGYEDKPAGKVDKTCGLVGGKDNFKTLLKHLKIALYGLKFDTLTLNSLLHGLKQARISYLNSIKCHKYKRLVLLAVIRWLFEDYIFILVRTHFYATDTSKTNSEIFYYTKSDWCRIVEEQLSKEAYKSVYNLEKIRDSDLAFYCSQYQSYGMHLGRLLPKNVKNECRVISGCKIYNPVTNKTVSSNFKFITLNSCLKWLISTNPELIGFACSNHKDLFQKYSKFLSHNYMNRTSNSIKHWNFLKFDLTKCFDSINMKELITYIDQLFRKYLSADSVFSLARYACVRFDVDMRHIRSKYDFLTVKHHVHEKAFRNGVGDFVQAFEQIRLSQMHRSQILVPLSVHDRNINSKKLLSSLRMCVQRVVIKVHNDLYERVNGILQGSICARNLADLYLGRIESRLFYYSNPSNTNLSGNIQPENRLYLDPNNEIILRNVDDYLVIGTNMEKIHKIKFMLKNELIINEDKTVEWIWSPLQIQIDFEIENDVDDLSDILANHSSEYFAWCGYDFDVRTLDVYFNFDKYFASQDNLNNRINSTNNYRNAFVTFNLRFLRLFGMHLRHFVLDTRINSASAVLGNCVDMFAISAIRFLIMTKQMPNQIRKNPKLQIKIIINLCYSVNNVLGTKVKRILNKYFYSTFSLLKFLCLSSFHELFSHFDRSCKSHTSLTNLIAINLKKLDFMRCIRVNSELVFSQLEKFVKTKVEKFHKCKI